MSEESKCAVFIIQESAAQSLVSDAGTLATFVVLIGIGWFLQSDAMQWAGAGLGFLAVFSAASGTSRFTIAQARAELDRLEAMQS